MKYKWCFFHDVPYKVCRIREIDKLGHCLPKLISAFETKYRLRILKLKDLE